jgi:NAD(P)-dependent dehydrogenase (short-subunit alcohol dehydrogenase family)
MSGPSLVSFRSPYRAAVFGASGGIGGALVSALAADPNCSIVYGLSRNPISPAHPKLHPLTFDLLDEESIRRSADAMTHEAPLDLCIVATGMLSDKGAQPEKSWRSLDPSVMRRGFEINAIGPALIAKHVLDRLPKDRKSVFACLSARVGSIADNRLGGWHTYRSSKAALNMIIRSLSIELRRKNPSAVCVSLHPGTVLTPLSTPFAAAAQRPFLPDESAAMLLATIDRLSPEDTGGFQSYSGDSIPF